MDTQVIDIPQKAEKQPYFDAPGIRTLCPGYRRRRSRPELTAEYKSLLIEADHIESVIKSSYALQFTHKYHVTSLGLIPVTTAPIKELYRKRKAILNRLDEIERSWKSYI